MAKQRRSSEEVGRLVKEYESSGLTRREFCVRYQIPVTTLDSWRRARARPQRMVKVEVAASDSSTLTLILGNGRSIRSSGGFADEELIRLIRVAERA